MTLGSLIKTLEDANPDKIVKIGFGYPHSYRGYYDDLAFEPRYMVTVSFMLAAAKSALGSTYPGWKGGEYTMNEYTTVWLAYEGQEGEGIGPVLLSYMLGRK